jgi:beta-phosphoglucomutase-like phosphatase (HAD superfamily)
VTRLLACAAVAFDMDGVLLDTEAPARGKGELPIGWKAEAQTAARLGWTYTARDHAALIGVDHKRTAQYLYAAAPAAERARTNVHAVAGDLMARLMRIIHEDGVKATRGAGALVRGCRDAGLLTAVVTSSERQFAYAALGQADMRFDAWIDAQTTDAHKPAPDPYLAAVAALDTIAARSGRQIWAGDCAGIEDTLTGLLSMHDAKIGTTITVPTPGQKITHAATVGRPPGYVLTEDERQTAAAVAGCVILRSLDGLEATPEGLVIRDGY